VASTAAAPAADQQTRPRRRELLQQLAMPLRHFLQTEAGSAGLLLAATLAALVWANVASGSYEDLWNTDLSVRIGDHALVMDLRDWVNDGLMVFFFFVIGLEVRRELSMGELTDRRTVRVPALAALAGAVVPAAIFLAINPSGDAANGWGVVIATDTAFLLGALALIGPACPTQLRVFLLTLSIVDDIAAITVIGVFYSDSIDFVALIVAGACALGIVALGRLDLWRGPGYFLVGGGLWVAMVESGLHPTIAGMVAGLLVTVYQPRRERVEQAASLARAFRQSPVPSLARSTKLSVERAVSPNERLQALLHPWTSFVIVPLFALANAGVYLGGGLLGDAFSSPLTWGVIAGLVGGKLAGVGATSLGAVRLRLGRLPQGVGSGQVLGGAALAGIGFTVSLLIVELGLDSAQLRDEAKVGVLTAAALAALSGWAIFRLAAVLRGERTAGLPMFLDRPVESQRDHIRGAVDAPLTIVEYGDFECPFCGRATGMVKELRHRLGDDLRYVFRHLPLTDVHPHAELAAEAAEAAAAQGRFWEYHDLLFEHQDRLELEDLIGYADELGLDVERFTRELEEGVHSRRVREDVASADASGARGTPTFFVGERRHVGPYDAETLAAELRASRRPVAA
jgi:Na+/H+ antiporter NhaA